MARKYKQGEVLKGYTIKRDDFFNTGAFAFSYAAKDRSGRKVFFKQYKSPSIRVDWYRKYVNYQKELKRRIDGDTQLKEFCYEMIDFFEEKKCYHQVFGWVESSEDLSKILEKIKAGRGPDFAQRVILAKRLMGSMAALHNAKIIHADLKPENLQLISDTTILAGYKLVLIDMDFSVLSDETAPWHDDPGTGYVGSPNYYSPEHLRGEAPEEASDVYSCSLILHQLLGVGHPYESEEPGDYKDKALDYQATKPKLKGEIKDSATTALVADYLHRCLHPNPGERPTARLMRDALNGKAPTLGPADAVLTSARRPKKTTKKKAKKKPGKKPKKKTEPKLPPVPVSTLILEGSTGASITIKIDTSIGKSTVSRFGKDAQFWSEPQFRLERSGTDWTVLHGSRAKNETLLNGKNVTKSQPVKNGDQLAVGRESKGIIKLPLKVKIRK
jgi:serine/threonine protein kinase